MEQRLSSLERSPSLSHSIPSAAAVNVANFVPTKLHWLSGVPDTNYESWKQRMEFLLESQGLMEYVDGRITLPLGPDIDYNVWKRTDALVKGWIVGSLCDQIASTTVVRDKAAHQIWGQLATKFGRPEKASGFDVSEKPKKCVNDSTPLHRAALEGDWETAQRIFTVDPDAKTDWIDGNNNWRALHIAVGTGEKAIHFVRNLVQLLDPLDLLTRRDGGNSTALHIAASVGNKAAAELLVERNPAVCNQQNKHSHFPIHVAALYVQREVLEFLIEHTKPDKVSDPYSGREGQQLLTYLIQSDFFDIALDLAEKYPSLLKITSLEDGDDVLSPLALLTIKKKALSTRHLGIWERFIFSRIVSLETKMRSHSTWNRTHDIEGITTDATQKSSVFWLDFQCMLWKGMEFLVPEKSKKIKAAQQAQQLLKRMSKEIGSQDFDQAAIIFREAIFIAAELGVREVVEVIIETFPGAIYSHATPSGQHIFHKAIESRSVDVFNLIYEMSDHKILFTSYIKDNYENTPLHSAAKLAPPHKLSETSGAALQMQREMQWFQAVEKVVHPYSKEQKNCADKTPKTVFTEEHSLLKESGEKWMKETANSFTFVAALIATVMFTGAITVPGGNENNTGFPMFSKEPAFVTFAVSVAGSLFASTTSLLLFVAILTARYAEEDFLSSLPKKLMFGLGTLFLSVIFMVVSFIATLYLVFGQKRQWVLFPLLVFACMPVASFVFYQYPLLRDLYYTTCGRGIFGKKGKRGFY